MEHFTKLLHKRQLKATPARLAILKIIHDFKGAVPFSHLKKVLPKPHRSTVFRTLISLEEKGIIHKTVFEDNETYYALCPSGCHVGEHLHDHFHFRCRSCDTVTCENLSQQLSLGIKGGQIDKIEVNVLGLCNNCYSA